MNELLICVAFILGILFERYLFPILDTLLQVFQYKQSEKATIHQLNSQEAVALFNREYPELNQNQLQELSPAIGFTHPVVSDDMYFEMEDRK